MLCFIMCRLVAMIWKATNSLAKPAPNRGAEKVAARRCLKSQDQPLLPMARLNV